jgi:glycine/D-amino acid oxidase-like deaminating enzyme
MPSIEQACFWLAGLPAREVTPLRAPTETGIAIIGGGFTGFWTALFLKELDPSGDVAVVEQGIAGYGASGRNAGMLSETVDHSHGLAIQHFGAREAAQLAAVGQENVQELVSFIRNCDIQCDYEPTGRLTVALTERHLEDGQRHVEIARQLGIDSFRMLSREETQAEVHSPLYLGAVEGRGGGILDPAKLTDGLRREAERSGVRVFERTTVESIREEGTGVEIRANGTTLRARRVVLATSAYTHHLLPSVRRWFIPLYDYVLVSEPLTAAEWELIGWKRRQGVTDGRTFFNY